MVRPLLILLTLLYATCAFANDEDRAERRELRDRREKIRQAVRRVEKCFASGDLSPCMDSTDDIEIQQAVMKYYMKRHTASGENDARGLLNIGK